MSQSLISPRGALRMCVSLSVSLALLGALVWAGARQRAAAQTPSPPPDRAVELRNLGLAQLENEKYAEAEEAFLELTQIYPRDPLGFANLAISRLRQQKSPEALAAINQALSKAPNRPDLLFIRADVVAWIGNADAALGLYEQAVQGDPSNVEYLYGLYRHTTAMTSAEAAAAGRTAARALAELRPENLVVLLSVGKAALEEGDRAAASRAYLRVRELAWQLDARTKPLAERTLPGLLDALEANDLEAARVPSLRLENVFKASGAYKSSLAEVFKGIQGLPVERFASEPQVGLSPPGSVTFQAQQLNDHPVAALAGVYVPEAPFHVFQTGAAGTWVTALDADATPETASATDPAPAALVSVDLDNDGQIEVLGWSAAGAGVHRWRGGSTESFTPTLVPGLEEVRVAALDVLDFDSEGDLDVALVTTQGQLQLYRNALEGPLELAAAPALPDTRFRSARQVRTADVDADGDTDILVVHEGGVTLIDNNRQGTFSEGTAAAGFGSTAGTVALDVGDLDNDGLPDLVLAHPSGLRVLLQRASGFEAGSTPPTGSAAEAVHLVDVDNDGRLDIAWSGASPGLVQQTETGWRGVELGGLPEGGATLLAADRDGDLDLDLLAGTAKGLFWLQNEGGDAYGALRVTLRGLTEGNDKNNTFGRGTSLEVTAGSAYQYREVREGVTHFGLGAVRRADSLRAVWANGVPQHRLQPEANQLLVEEQVLKGSCPFLYTWNGEEITFVTDLLWGAPLGMPVAPGAWAASDPHEIVEVTGAAPRSTAEHGLHYDLRVTEELWEAAYFDRTRLWVVDAPDEVEVHSTLRVFPGPSPEGFPGAAQLVGVRNLRPVAGAWDGEGNDVTQRVAARDDVYADGYPVGDYQGIAARPWTFTFDLGTAPRGAFRLLLDGWIFPADASLNLAAAQRSDLDFTFTRLEAKTPEGWVPVLDPMGFPAGKTKTTVVDVPALPPGVRTLRIRTSRWLHWDRIVWSENSADDEIQIVATLDPQAAELRERGFSVLVREAPNGPHLFDYNTVGTNSPWEPMFGHYTRTGDVRPLLLAEDDQLVVMAAGDEMRLRFSAAGIPAPGPNTRRKVFLESVGWDKDADRNTYESTSAEPLPFRAMSGYPFAEGESYPDTPALARYREEWLTREVAPWPRGATRQGLSGPSLAPTGGRR